MLQKKTKNVGFVNTSEEIILAFTVQRDFLHKDSKADSPFPALRQLLLGFRCIDALQFEVMIR